MMGNLEKVTWVSPPESTYKFIFKLWRVTVSVYLCHNIYLKRWILVDILVSEILLNIDISLKNPVSVYQLQFDQKATRNRPFYKLDLQQIEHWRFS